MATARVPVDGDARWRVVLVDDESLIRAGLTMLLDAEPDIEVVGEASDGSSAIETVARLKPDVVVMDVRMPGVDGIEATRVLTSDDFIDHHGASAVVLILTTFNEDEAVRAAMDAGASGFILKNSAPSVLADAIRALATGGGWLDPTVTRGLIREFANRAHPALPTPTEMEHLTRREREVLIAVADGLTNAQIAQALYLSEATVKTHVHRIFMKLGITDRAHAVSVAFKSGMVSPRGSRRINSAD